MVSSRLKADSHLQVQGYASHYQTPESDHPIANDGPAKMALFAVDNDNSAEKKKKTIDFCFETSFFFRFFSVFFFCKEK